MSSSHLRISMLAVTMAVVMAGVATAAWAEDSRAASARPPYLALGDSVVFGFITQAGFEYINPDNFVGYPDYVALMLPLAATNASCPGETTGSFLSPIAADNGCRAFRQQVPLHVAYVSTQVLFAEGFLGAHRNTRLVTIGIGANDLFLLQQQCANDPNPQCIGAGLPGVLATIAGNMETILFALRATGFQGVLMIVNYYSLDYSDPVGTGFTQLLNGSRSRTARWSRMSSPHSRRPRRPPSLVGRPAGRGCSTRARRISSSATSIPVSLARNSSVRRSRTPFGRRGAETTDARAIGRSRLVSRMREESNNLLRRATPKRKEGGGPNGARSNLQNSRARFHCAVTQPGQPPAT